MFFYNFDCFYCVIQESNADENLSKPIQDENKIVPSIEAAGNANKNHSISEIQNVHTLPTNENNHASIVNSTAAENTIESATKVDDESLKPDNLTVTYIYFCSLF